MASASSYGQLSSVQDANCLDYDGYCLIESKEECEAAAEAFGATDTTASQQSRTSTPPGCYMTAGGALRWNSELSDDRGTQNADQTLFCSTDCGPDISFTGVYAHVKATVDAQCSDITGYCVIDSEAGCVAAATAFGADDTTVADQVKSDTLSGCYVTSRGSLRWNGNLGTEVVTNNEDQELYCTSLCTPTLPNGGDSTATEQTSDATKTGLAMWGVTVAMAATLCAVSFDLQ